MQGPAPDGRSEVYDVDAVYDALAMSEHIDGGFTTFVSECGRPAQPLNAFVLGMNRSGILLAFQNPLCREAGSSLSTRTSDPNCKLNTSVTGRNPSEQPRHSDYLQPLPLAFSLAAFSQIISWNEATPNRDLDTGVEAVIMTRILGSIGHVRQLLSELRLSDFRPDPTNSHLSARFQKFPCRFGANPRNDPRRSGKLLKVLVSPAFTHWRERSKIWALYIMRRLLQVRRYVEGNLMRKAILAWHKMTSGLAAAKNQVALAMFARSLQQEVFMRWVKFASKSAHVQSVLAAAIKRLRSTLMSITWNRWRKRVGDIHSIMCVVKFLEHRDKAARFRRWLERVVKVTAQREYMHICLKFRVHNLIAAIWNQWRKYVDDVGSARMAVKWSRERKKIGYWLRWRESLVGYKRAAYALKTKAFVHWVELSKKGHATRRNIFFAVQNLKFYTIKIAFKLWCVYMRNTQVTYELVHEMESRSQTFAMTIAWKRWSYRVECAQCAKHLTSKATAFVVKASMVKAWSTWREYRMSHAVSERALTFWVQCLMRKVFERWCQIARYRAFLWEMTSLSRAHRNARLRVVAWDSWRLLQSANVLDACARCHKYHLFLTSSFKRWTVATTQALIDMEHWRIAEDYNCRALIGITFTRWIATMHDLPSLAFTSEQQEIAFQHRIWRLGVNALCLWRKVAKAGIMHRKSITFAALFERGKRLEKYARSWYQWSWACWCGRVALARSQLRLWHSHVEEELIKREKNETASKHNKGRLRRRIFMTWLDTWLIGARVRLAKAVLDANAQRRALRKWRHVQHKAARIQQCLIRADRHYKGRALSLCFSVFVHTWAKRMLLRAFSYRRQRRSTMLVLRGWAKLMYEARAEQWAKRSTNSSQLRVPI
mmetsp:Transcript_2734/g.10137  ORF Transcript_2734/g.10137 Transcript_2734/m.10137 type:complete len:884 (-) Transcript_2734:1050-3701(-)